MTHVQPNIVRFPLGVKSGKSSARVLEGASRNPSRGVAVESTCWYIINMKAVQVMFDERLLEQLDATVEVQQEGRSAVLRRAVEHYLRRRRRIVIAEQYRKAYGSPQEPTEGPGDEFSGWEDEGAWPSK
jgi:hypothetical protein